MREEIRLGNEALARDDLETARRCFQQLLTAGGTPTQERIATNRLHEIQKRLEALLAPPTIKPRSRRKAPRVKEQDDTRHKFLRPPDNPIVVIKKH